MKIALFSHSAGVAGAERSMAALARVLVSRGHEVEVYVPEDGPVFELLIEGGVLPSSIRRCSAHRWMSRRGHSLAGVVRLAQCLWDIPRVLGALRRDRCDVLVVNTSVTPAPMVAGRLLGIPTVVLVREAIRTNPTLGSALPKWVLVKIIRACAERIIAVSEFTGAQADADQVVLEHVRTEPASRGPGERGPLRAVALGTVAASEKGQLDAVEAVGIALRAGADIRLDIYGGGVPAEVRALRRKIESLRLSNRVCYHGETDDVAGVLAQADVLLMTSRNEGFGRVTVEALEAGVPVVGYDAGGTSEILRRGGGLLVRPEPTQLASAIVRLAIDRELLVHCQAEATKAGALWNASRTDDDLADAIEQAASSARRASGSAADSARPEAPP